MAALRCPACRATLTEAGFTHRCETCNGAWIVEDVVVGMLEERAATLIQLPWAPRVGAQRPCADCAEPMQTVHLGDVALDRCPPHGVWFDDKELAALLAEAKHFVTPVPAHHASLLDALRGLLR